MYDAKDTDLAIRPSDESFGTRWSRRKLDSKKQQPDQTTQAQPASSTDKPLLTDADMPPIETLNADSDISGFFSPKVSDELRKLALRKLFQCPEFNICDGLDDYDEDFTSFEKLGDIVTADMRHQIEMEARKKLALDDESSPKVETVEEPAEHAATIAEENPTEAESIAKSTVEPDENGQEETL